jgi:hypothetical protein
MEGKAPPPPNNEYRARDSLAQRIGIIDRIPSKKVWFGSEVFLPVCGNSLLIELPADHKNGGGGDLHGSSASVTVARWPSSRPQN